MSGSLLLDQVEKSFGPKKVLDGISFKAEAGEFLVLVGPSGCGKSTVLRSIAGLESIDAGRILIDAQDVSGKAPKDRDIAMVFQDYALYPHKSVYENIAFGLKIRRVPQAEIDRRVKDAAAKLNLTGLLERRPAALSGGQRQRVAIGRAIVRDPKVFLFDEPLSNLDAKLRGTMRVEISKLHKELNATIVYVTHDQVEAMTLADKIIVLDSGHVQQMGTPLDLYYHPSNVFVATFIGSPPMNLVEGVLAREGDELRFVSDNGLTVPIRAEHASVLQGRVGEGQRVIWGVRPENLRYAEDVEDTERPVYEAEVIVTELLGPTTSVHCSIKGHEINVMLPAPRRPKRGEKIRLALVSKHLYLFDQKTQLALL